MLKEIFDQKHSTNTQKMILSNEQKNRKKAIMELLPYQKKDFYSILKEMAPMPVTIRLLDPPLHEFLPSQKNIPLIKSLAKSMKVTEKQIHNRIIDLFEINPMLGHRGCRLAISFPEITETDPITTTTEPTTEPTIEMVTTDKTDK